MPDDKLNEAQIKAAMDAEVAAKLNAEKVSFYREQYKALNSQDSDIVDLIDNPEAIKKMIQKKNEEMAAAAEEEKKKKEKDSEDEEEEPDKKKDNKTNTMRVNASGTPEIHLPNGKIIEGENGSFGRINNALDPMHLIDPLRAPKTVGKFRNSCRLNPLPPDEDHPYERVIA